MAFNVDSTCILLLLLVDYLGQCYGYALRKFQFQCYNTDLCTFPLQYCSSDRHNQRCLPCLPSVCQEETPPLQCSYNCTLATRQIHDAAADGSSIIGWMVGTGVLGGVTVFLFIMCCLLLWRKTARKKVSEPLKSDIELSDMTKTPLMDDNDASSKHRTADGDAEADRGDNWSQTHVTPVAPRQNGDVKTSQPVQDGQVYNAKFKPVTSLTTMSETEGATNTPRAPPTSAEEQP